MRLASSAWPRALLSLCEPVWLRSSRIIIQRPAYALGQAPRAIQRCGAPAEVAQQALKLRAVVGVLTGGEPCLLKLGQCGHQRLWDKLAAIAAKTVLNGAHAGEPTDT